MIADALISQALALHEDRMPILRKKWAGISMHHERQSLRAAGPEVADVVGHVTGRMDPTPTKSYSDRLLHWYNKGQFRLEDRDRIHAAVSGFHKQKNRITAEHAGPEVANPKDFNSYPSIHHVEHALRSLTGAGVVDTPWTKTTAAQREAVKHGSEVVHDDDDLTVRHVKTHDAMKVLGAKTSWCVVPDKDTFDSYSEQGPIYHIHNKNSGQRALLHFESDQLMDENDDELEHDDLSAAHPVLKKLFKGHHYSMFNDPKANDRDILDGEHDKNASMLSSAADYSKNPHVVERIAAMHSADHAVRRGVVHNPHATGNALRSVYDATKHPASKGSPDEYNVVHERLAAHENTPHDVLHDLVDHAPRSRRHQIFNALALNKNAPGELLRKAGESALRTLSDPHLTRDEMHQAHLASYVVDRVGAHHNVPRDTADKLIDWAETKRGGNEAASHASSVAENPNADVARLKRAYGLVGNGDRGAIMSIAAHKNADESLLRHIYDTHGDTDWVAEAVANNKNTPRDLIHKMIRKPHLLGAVARSPHLDHDLAERIVNSLRPTTQQHNYYKQMEAVQELAKHPHMKPELLRRVHEKGVRMVDHYGADARQLLQLLHNNRNTPEDVKQAIRDNREYRP